MGAKEMKILFGIHLKSKHRESWVQQIGSLALTYYII